jgi:hypothetical protein
VQTKPIECPIVPVENEIREGIVVYTVPEEFRARLAKVVLTRRALNKRGAPTPAMESYFHASRGNENEYALILAEMRALLGVPAEATFEFHSLWRYSITTFESELMRYEQQTAKKEPEIERVAGALSFKYREDGRPQEVCHLEEYFRRRRVAERRKKRTAEAKHTSRP